MTRGDYFKIAGSSKLSAMRGELISVMGGSSTLTGGQQTNTRGFLPDNTVSLMNRLSGGFNSTTQQQYPRRESTNESKQVSAM